MTGPRFAAAGGLLALPWCCLLPAALSLIGFGAGVVGEASGWIRWTSLVASLALSGWANMLAWYRGQGALAARRFTLLFSAGTLGLWLWRLGPYFHW